MSWSRYSLERWLLEHIPIIRELTWRGVLAPPPLIPRYLHRPDSLARINKLRRGIRGLWISWKRETVMKIGFLVNDVKTEKVGFTTVRLATEAVNQGS